MIKNRWYEILFTQTGLILICISLVLIIIVSFSFRKSNNNSGILSTIGAGVVAIIGFMIYNFFKKPQDNSDLVESIEKAKKNIDKKVDNSIQDINKTTESIEKLKQIKDSLKQEEISKDNDLKKASKKLKNL